LALNDFRSALNYYTFTGWMGDAFEDEWQIENLYMETQGNWNAFKQSYWKSLRVHY
jgi:hypothetical protein